MKLQLPVSIEEKYRYIVEILGSSLKPFNQLRPRERDVIGLLYYYNYKHRDIPEAYRDTITFGADVKKEIAAKLDNMSMDNLYNILLELRKKDIIIGESFNQKYLKPIQDIDSITFEFITK